MIAGCHCFSVPEATERNEDSRIYLSDVASGKVGKDMDMTTREHNSNMEGEKEKEEEEEKEENEEFIAVETFKTFGSERLALSSTLHYDHQQTEREGSLGTAAFVEFEVPLSRCGSRWAFVPCSQDFDIVGEYTLRVYSSSSLQWTSLPVEMLEEEINTAPPQQIHGVEDALGGGGGQGRGGKELMVIDNFGEIHGEWIVGGDHPLCGGCRNYETWLENPSFLIPVVRDAWLSIVLTCDFEYDRLLTSQAPAAGMCILAGDEEVAKREGRWLIGSSPFVRDEKNTWELMLAASDVPYTLLVCTYQPKCRGTFVVQVNRLEEN